MTGIFFDIDDTLYSRRALLGRAARETVSDPVRLIGESGSEEEAHFLEIFYRFSDENFPQIIAGKITPWQSNVERYVNTLRFLGEDVQEEEGVRFADRYTYLLEHIEMSQQLHDLMRSLCARADLRLGVISNGTSERQRGKYYKLGLDRYIDPESVIVSGDLGISKPEPEIFRAAQDLFGMKPDELWMVGDSLKADIRGAKACGWHTLWLRRVAEQEEEADTDLIAGDEEEMCRLLMQVVSQTVPSSSQRVT